MEQKKPTNLVRALARGLDILEALAARPEGMGVRELADVLGLKPPTVHNLLRTLRHRGYVARATAPVRYRLGPAAGGLGGRSRAAAEDARHIAALRRLAGQFPRATVTYAEPVGQEVRTTLRIAPERPGVLQRPDGRVMPPYTSASALVVQAFRDADERLAFQRAWPFDEYAAGAWATPAELDAFLAEVRARGWARPRNCSDGRLRVAVPVFAPGGEPRGALGLALAADEADLAAIIAALEAAAAAAGSPSDAPPQPTETKEFAT